jgi:hypothetical protein
MISIFWENENKNCLMKKTQFLPKFLCVFLTKENPNSATKCHCERSVSAESGAVNPTQKGNTNKELPALVFILIFLTG